MRTLRLIWEATGGTDGFGDFVRGWLLAGALGAAICAIVIREERFLFRAKWCTIITLLGYWGVIMVVCGWSPTDERSTK